MSNNLSYGSKCQGHGEEVIEEVESVSEFNDELYTHSAEQVNASLESFKECYKAKPSKELGDIISELEKTINLLN